MKFFFTLLFFLLTYSFNVFSELKKSNVLIKNSDLSEKLITVEIADTPKSRMKGLMGRQDLPNDTGMIFVWDNEKFRHFWMKNTPLSLDIIFFDENGLFINAILNTKPFSLERLSSEKPSQFVLELIAGSVLNYKITNNSRLIATFIELQ